MQATLDATGSVPQIKVVPVYGEVAELRVHQGGATMVLRGYESQLAGVAHQINQFLDRRFAERARVVQSQAAPVEGAAR